MLTIPAALVAEKNKLHDSGAAIELLEISISELSTTLYLTSNDENVSWNGITWTAFPFRPGEVSETSEGELPRFDIQVSNVSRVIQGYLEQTEHGLVGDNVTYRLVHEDHLGENPYMTEIFTVRSSKCDAEWVTFTLGCVNLYNYRFPRNYFRYNLCRWKNFKDDHCGYAGASTSCARTLQACISLANEERFGGFPGMIGGFFDVSSNSSIITT